MPECDCEIALKDEMQSKVLIALLAINALMFLIEMYFGIISQSTALIADSLDMLADASVYGISLYAVGKRPAIKINAARTSGVLQIILGFFVLGDVLRRLIFGSSPETGLMIAIGFLALIANVICLLLIAQHKNGEIHMRASWIFSKNDVIANLGIILAGGLIYLLNSRLPDLIIGCVIATIVIRGGLHIVNDANREKYV